MKLVLAILATLDLAIVIAILGYAFISCIRERIKNSAFTGLALIAPLLGAIAIVWVLYFQG